MLYIETLREYYRQPTTNFICSINP